MYLKYVLNILSPLKLRAEAAPSTFGFVTVFDVGASVEFFGSLAQVNEFISLEILKNSSIQKLPRDTTPKIILYFIRDNKQTKYY
jgi:hypothetical protein